MTDYPIIAVVGPTACGKTRRGVEIARNIGGEIVSGDSRQIYCGMDIGTGKDLCEYGEIPFHLIDIVPAGYKYNLYEYVRDANNAIAEIQDREKYPVLVGGSGLYVETLLKGLTLPEVPVNRSLRDRLEDKSLEELTDILSSMKKLHNITDVDTTKRAIRAIEIATYYNENPTLAPNEINSRMPESIILYLDIDRENRRERITLRLHERLKEGMIEEVKALLSSGIKPEDLIYYGLEYKYVTSYLIGKRSYESMVGELEIAIHQFAKRQATWFRGMERRGFTLHHIPYDVSHDDLIKTVRNLIEEKSQKK